MLRADEVVAAFLEDAGIEHVRTGPASWAGMLRGERKHTIPISLTIRGDVLHVESFFMRRPQENLDRFYALLLRRNARAYGIAFTLDGIGDVYLVGQRSADGLTAAELDRIVGSILTEADGLFDAAIELGFESYLAADRAWRERSGTPPQPPP